MPTKKPRNPDHVRRRNTPQADNEVITEHLQNLLSPAIYAQSTSASKLGITRPHSQPGFDGCFCVNFNLATDAISARVSSDVRAAIVMGKSG